MDRVTLRIVVLSLTAFSLGGIVLAAVVGAGGMETPAWIVGSIGTAIGAIAGLANQSRDDDKKPS